MIVREATIILYFHEHCLSAINVLDDRMRCALTAGDAGEEDTGIAARQNREDTVAIFHDARRAWHRRRALEDFDCCK